MYWVLCDVCMCVWRGGGEWDQLQARMGSYLSASLEQHSKLSAATYLHSSAVLLGAVWVLTVSTGSLLAVSYFLHPSLHCFKGFGPIRSCFQLVCARHHCAATDAFTAAIPLQPVAVTG